MNAAVSTDRPLTLRQREYLDAIVRLRDRLGYPPSLRELADEMRVRDHSSVRYALTQLVAAGRIKTTYGVSRSIVVTRTD